MSVHEAIHAQLRSLLNDPATASEAGLNNALRLLAKYRCLLIQNTLVQQLGATVQAGPFAGLNFVEQSAEGCHIPKLLGCYEEELHPFLMSLPEAEYVTVLNVGCAEGYYAVGIKRLLPGARVLAYDTNPTARAACQDLASRNSVEVEVGGLFDPQDFAQFAGSRVLVWCDIEGAESGLLNSELAPAIKHMDVVVEFHQTPSGHTIHDVLPRFKDTHDIEILHARGHTPRLPAFLQQLGHLDQLLAQWEWRSSPTPWAIMRARRG